MGSVTILKPPSLSSSLLSSEPNIPEDQKMKTYQHYIDARGEVLPTHTETTTAVATSK